jgi:hypothetical protein
VTPTDNTSATPFKTPDITPEDVAVFVGVLATIATTLGVLNISDMQKATLTTALVALWGAFQLIAGAVRRHGRAQIAAAQITKGP